MPSPRSLARSLSLPPVRARGESLSLSLSLAVPVSLPRSSSPSYASLPHLAPSYRSRSRSPSRTPQSLPLLSHSIPWPRRLADSFCTRDNYYDGYIRGRLRARVAAPRALLPADDRAPHGRRAHVRICVRDASVPKGATALSDSAPCLTFTCRPRDISAYSPTFTSVASSSP